LVRQVANGMFCLMVLSLVPAGIAADRQQDEAERVRIERTRAYIEEKGYTWRAGPTSVSNLTDEEFQRLLGLRVPPDFEKRLDMAGRAGRLVRAPAGMYFPVGFDWRDEGGVTPVKNQGSCGSCWAFCAAAAFESQVLIYSGQNMNISEQAVLSCNTEGDDCGGGWMETAYDLWIDYGAVEEKCMPYHEVDTDPCIQESCGVAAVLDSFYYVGDTVDDIKTALLNGPVAAAMAVCGGFGSYTGGCYEDICTEINHGITIVGWDDSMCDGDGAWIVKNSWGPDFGVDGYIYMKYGTCYVGYGASVLDYTPGQTVHFFHDSHEIDDSSGDGDGNMETGEVIGLTVTLLNIGAETATSVAGRLASMTPGVEVLDSLATYPDIPKGETRPSNGPHFSLMVAPGGPACGAVRLHLTVSSDQGASSINMVVQAGELIEVFDDDFESDRGWTVGDVGDGASTGIWDRGDPEATWWGDQPCQPGDDHTESPGTDCYVTGLSAGSSQGTHDVDGGKTTLLSPAIDLSEQTSAVLAYYRWFANETGSNPNDDDFIVGVSHDGGLSWTNLETVSCSAREWVRKEFYLEDYVPLTHEIRVRFIADDSGVGGSIVEAAVDDFSIVACGAPGADAIEPVVTVIAPNGGEVCTYHTYYEIQWDATDNVGVASVSILLSTDCGETFTDTIAAGEANDGSYTWWVPDMDSRTACVKIVAYDAAMNQGEDLSDADFILWGSLSGADRPEYPEIPDHIALEVQGGNPAAPSTRIVFGLPAPSDISLDIYDVTGRFAFSLVSGRRAEGYHTIDWNPGSPARHHLTPGIYFVRLGCGGGVRTAKLVIAD
jgi:C1A family cysteine protease